MKDMSGRSIGKRVIGLKIVNKRDHKTKPKWRYLIL